IDLVQILEVLSVNPNLNEFLLLKALDDVEPSPTPYSPRGIGAVRNVLKFLQHELGNHQHTSKEAGLHYVCDSSIYDYARIENLGKWTSARSPDQPGPIRESQFLDLNTAQH